MPLTRPQVEAGIAASLRHWPADAAGPLARLIQAHAHAGAYAVFDADNTTYHHDLLGALLAFMELRGLLTRETMAPALELIPFRDTAIRRESLNSYYHRLGEIDDQVGYPWATQIFAGLSLRTIKRALDDMLALDAPIPAWHYAGDEVCEQSIEVPRMQRGQQELFGALMAHGIEVYMVSAASEEIVRMVVSLSLIHI